MRYVSRENPAASQIHETGHRIWGMLLTARSRAESSWISPITERYIKLHRFSPHRAPKARILLLIHSLFATSSRNNQHGEIARRIFHSRGWARLKRNVYAWKREKNLELSFVHFIFYTLSLLTHGSVEIVEHLRLPRQITRYILEFHWEANFDVELSFWMLQWQNSVQFKVLLVSRKEQVLLLVYTMCNRRRWV